MGYAAVASTRCTISDHTAISADVSALMPLACSLHANMECCMTMHSMDIFRTACTASSTTGNVNTLAVDGESAGLTMGDADSRGDATRALWMPVQERGNGAGTQRTRSALRSSRHAGLEALVQLKLVHEWGTPRCVPLALTELAVERWLP